MPRRKKISSKTDTVPAEMPDSLDGFVTDISAAFPRLKLPPQVNQDGSTNKTFYQQLYLLTVAKMTDALLAGTETGFNVSVAMTAIARAAELAGLDPSTIQDARPSEEIAAAAFTRLCEQPSYLYEMIDSELDAMESQMDNADSKCKEVQESMRRFAEGKEVEAIISRGKSLWRTRIARVRRLRERARNEFPEGSSDRDRHAIESAHLLRYMVYAGRASVPVEKDGTPASSVFRIGNHHAKMAVDLWTAENGVHFSGSGRIKGGCPYEGAIIVCPPGHGKTEIGIHWCALRLNQNTRECFLIGHAQALVAVRNLKSIKALFDPEMPQGARSSSLFMNRIDPSEDAANRFRLFQSDGFRTKAPAVAAFGAKARISGVDATKIWFDDMVDQDAVESDGERTKGFNRIQGTWLLRKRGRHAFDLTTTTLWHEDDANMRRIRLAQNGQARLRVSVQGCGGPSTNPPFKALFPEIYDSAALRRKFNEMRNPHLYSCAYMSDPTAVEDRPISRLAMYDPDGREHADFLSTARIILSVDPAGTNKVTSDPAALVLLAVGDVLRVRGDSVQSDRRLRVLECKEKRLNQVELVQFISEYASIRSIDEIYVETKSGYAATADMLENHFGVQVVRCEPGRRQKEARFRGVAGLMDDGMQDNGGPPAVVEFPGKTEQERLCEDERLDWVYRQFLHFGQCKEDHVLDAVVQVAERVASELNAGVPGAVSRIMREKVRRVDADPRLIEEAERIMYGRKEMDNEEADWAILN